MTVLNGRVPAKSTYLWTNCPNDSQKTEILSTIFLGPETIWRNCRVLSQECFFSMVVWLFSRSARKPLHRAFEIEIQQRGIAWWTDTKTTSCWTMYYCKGDKPLWSGVNELKATTTMAGQKDNILCRQNSWPGWAFATFLERWSLSFGTARCSMTSSRVAAYCSTKGTNSVLQRSRGHDSFTTH